MVLQEEQNVFSSISLHCLFFRYVEMQMRIFRIQTYIYYVKRLLLQRSSIVDFGLGSEYSPEIGQFLANHSITAMFRIFPAQVFYLFIYSLNFFQLSCFILFSRNYWKRTSYKEGTAKMWVKESFRRLLCSFPTVIMVTWLVDKNWNLGIPYFH